MSVTDTKRAHPKSRGPALVVAGMHRSGTSAMARVLSLAGAALPERVIQPGPDNPLGFWEPWEMVALSDEILSDIGSSWDDIFVHAADSAAWDRREAFLDRAQAFVAHNFGDRPLPVIKDPRASALTRLWRQALVDGGYRPVYVIMARHPLEVAGSLAARDGFPTAKSLLVWAAYMLAAERDTRGESRVFVAYPDLIADWRAVLDRIAAVTAAPLPTRDDATAAEIDRFLSRTHRHHEADDAALAALGVLPVVELVHGWVRAAAAGQTPDPAIMDAAARTMDQLRATFEPIQVHERSRAEERETSLKSALADAETRLLRARAHGIELELGLAERDAEASTRIRDLECALAVEARRADAGNTEAAHLRTVSREANLCLTGLELELMETQQALAKAHLDLTAESAAAAASDERSAQRLQQIQARDVRIGTLEQDLDEAHLNLTTESAAAAASDERSAQRLQQIQARDIRIGTLEQDLDDRQRRIHALETEQADLKARVESLQAVAESLQARIDTIKRSVGWKVARPIRVIEGRLKRRKAPTH